MFILGTLIFVDITLAFAQYIYYFIRHVYGIDTTPLELWKFFFPSSRLLSASKPNITFLDFETKQMFVIELSYVAKTNITSCLSLGISIHDRKLSS